MNNAWTCWRKCGRAVSWISSVLPSESSDFRSWEWFCPQYGAAEYSLTFSCIYMQKNAYCTLTFQTCEDCLPIFARLLCILAKNGLHSSQEWKLLVIHWNTSSCKDEFIFIISVLPWNPWERKPQSREVMFFKTFFSWISLYKLSILKKDNFIFLIISLYGYLDLNNYLCILHYKINKVWRKS